MNALDILVSIFDLSLKAAYLVYCQSVSTFLID